jgi:hypothetical protein
MIDNRIKVKARPKLEGTILIKETNKPTTSKEKSKIIVSKPLHIHETNKPTMFKKKSKIVVSKPLTYIGSDTGKTRHFTPAAQEWYNSIYTYDSNYVKSLPIADKNLMNLLKSYFNIHLSKKILKMKTKPMQMRFKRLSTKRTFVGKGHLKHTSNKVIVTFFVYNTEGMFLSGAVEAMYIAAISPKKALKCHITWENNDYITKTYNRFFTINEEWLYCRERKGLYYSVLISLINGLTVRLDSIKEYLTKITGLANKVLTKDDKPELFNVIYSNVLQLYHKQNSLIIKYPSFYEFRTKFKEILKKEYKRYILLLKINKIKFNDTFISKLIYLVNKIYKKKVEFNIVNLKKMHLNSDIYTQAVSLKLRNKDNKLYRILKASLRKIKVPTISKISEKQNKPNKNEFLVNKIRNNIISFMFRDDDVKDPLSSLLLDFYPLADNIKVVRNKKSSALTVALTNSIPSQSLDEPERMHVKNLRAISLKSYVHRWLKHMRLRGIRVEAKGRLTRRATASRSVFKMKWKGGLKNVDSSFRGLSTIMLRGYAKSNVQYSLINSKNRNGAFGVKGWVSSK